MGLDFPVIIIMLILLSFIILLTYVLWLIIRALRKYLKEK